MIELPENINLEAVIDFISTPSFQTFQIITITYVGLLWLSVIIWVIRDAIHRSDSLLFQVIAILINIIFPILGVLIYLIIRPSKTTMEKYYEELENRLVLEAITDQKKVNKKAVKKPEKKVNKK